PPTEGGGSRLCRCRRCTCPGACERARGPRGPGSLRRCTSMPAPLVHSLSTLGVSEGLDHDRLADQNERRPLDHLITLASARLDLFRIGLELERLATLLRLDLEHVGFLARDKPDHAVVVG